MSLGYAKYTLNTVTARASYGARRFLSTSASNRIFSTAAAHVNSFDDMSSVAQKASVRARFVEVQGATVDVGFTDGSEYRFPSSWLRSVIAGPDADEVPSVVSTATVEEGSLAVSVEWDGDEAVARSIFDANMLRSYADKVAVELDGVDPQNPVLGAKPFKGPAVWTGRDLLASPWWGLQLTEADIADLKAATKHAMEHHVEWRAPCVPEPLSKDQFPLGDAMAKKLQGLADEIEFGKGLGMIRNMPVPALDPSMTEEDLAVMYIGVSGHIGNIVMQSSSGLRSVSRGYGMPLGRVQAEMTGETPKGGLQTNNHFRLHTDRSDVISLMSLRTAPSGGASRVCSVPAVYNALLERKPELAKVLTEPIDRIWEGVNGFFRLPVIGMTPSGQCTSQISPSYVENAQFLDNATKASPLQVEALDAIEEVGMELGVEFVMQPGMLYFLNNHQIYHGRGNWSVTKGEESGAWGNEGRLLFRTWISPYNSRPLPDTDEYRTVWGSVEGGKPRGGWDQAVKTGDSPKPKIPADHVYYSLYSDRVQKHSMEGHCGVVVEY